MMLYVYNEWKFIDEQRGYLFMKMMEELMHPVRMKIALTLMQKQDDGMTTLELAEKLKDVSQATLYRHIQQMLKSNIIYILHKQKVRAVTENYYAINEDAININPEDWHEAKKQEKIDFISYYQLFVLHQYQSYLDYLDATDAKEDKSTFSIIDLNLTDEDFNDFLTEMSALIHKYHGKQSDNQAANRTVALTIIPHT